MTENNEIKKTAILNYLNSGIPAVSLVFITVYATIVAAKPAQQKSLGKTSETKSTTITSTNKQRSKSTEYNTKNLQKITPKPIHRPTKLSSSNIGSISDPTTQQRRNSLRASKTKYSAFTIQNSSTTPEDPVEAQIASELIKELRDEVPTKRQNNEKFKPLAGIQFQNTFKIHLSRSSRMPIPLPENNAFCFTNPNSPLCRTFI
ncbi:uncharacterized protein LOC114245130 [Bombyx mandarina]|uniref:Uncharacterized protein LOC114245130 n=1 Tax=Bombyx mandarina TaxID=7092 RepID=A0A6J2JTM9_BOMMA|nr:uncharacterized protein LOC114245130 [Bombyx mandarina]